MSPFYLGRRLILRGDRIGIQPLHLTRRHYGFSGFNVSPAAAQVNGVVSGKVHLFNGPN